MSKLPNGPKSPSWWQLIHWIRHPAEFQKQCADRYGDIFTLRLWGFEPLVIVSDPQGIQEIFNQDPKHFDVGRSNYFIEPLVGNNSLLLLDGQRHQRERKLLMPAFHGQRLQSYAQSICDIASLVASRWQEGQQLIARQVMQEITLEVILQVVFGLGRGENYQTLKSLLAEMLNIMDSPVRSSFIFFQFLQQDWGNWSPWGRIKQRQRQIYALLQAEIDKRRSQNHSNSSDILSLMMSATDEQGQHLTDAELKDELLTLLVAGHETTANTLAWAFYQILKHPQVLQHLRQEIDDLGNDRTPIVVAQQAYLNATCKEILRMHPVAPIAMARITKSAIEVMGYQFEPNTYLVPSIYLVHYREDLYPESEQFRPERFLERQYSPYEYFPFGGGNRRCLGYALAELEMKLVLATILSNYELALASDETIEPQRRGLNIAPAGGVPLIFKGKRTSQLQSSQNLVGSPS